MPRLNSSIDIKAPLEKVFAYVSDVEAQPEWCKWAKDVSVTSETRGKVGATDEMRMQVGPRKETVEGLITELREGEAFSRRHTRGLEMSENYVFEASELGTKVDWTVEYKAPMGALGKLMDFLFMERLFEQLQGDSLTNLKQRLESAK